MKKTSVIRMIVLASCLATTVAIGQMPGSTRLKPERPQPKTGNDQLIEIIAQDLMGGVPIELYPPGYIRSLHDLGDNLLPEPVPKTQSEATFTALSSGAEFTMTDQETPSAARYILTDLGTLGGGSSEAHAINNQGLVVGMSETATSMAVAFLWSNGSMQNLGTLGGTTSDAWDINANGQIAGHSRNSDGNIRAFLQSNGIMQNLGTNSGDFSKGFAINDSGQVVGVSGDFANIWFNGSMQDLGGSYSCAYGINNAGQVVGESRNEYGQSRAYLWSSGSMQELGTIGGSTSRAKSINDSSQIVGWSRTANNSQSHAFLWSSGIIQDLGTLGGTISEADSINNLGQVVGWSYTSLNDKRGFLWSNGTMHNLNDLLVQTNTGWIIEEAYDINDSGQICGYASKEDGSAWHAILLTQVPLPILTATNLGGGTLGISFTSQTGVTYVVESSDSLNPSAWNPVQTIVATGSTTSFTRSMTSPMQFFRVKANY